MQNTEGWDLENSQWVNLLKLWTTNSMIRLLNIQHHYLLHVLNLSDTLLREFWLPRLLPAFQAWIGRECCLENTCGRHLVQLPGWSRTVVNTRSRQQWLLLVKSWDCCDLSIELFWACTTFLMRGLFSGSGLGFGLVFFQMSKWTLQAAVSGHCLPLYHLALPRGVWPDCPYNCSSYSYGQLQGHPLANSSSGWKKKKNSSQSFFVESVL